MADLSILTATTQVEEALQSAIALPLQARLTIATAAALAALPSLTRTHLELARLTSTGIVWRFNRYSTAAASASVIVPDDAPTAGRWLVTTSTATGGYFKSVKLYDGEVDEEQFLVWLFGQVPSCIIVWDGEDYTPKSTIAGALYWTAIKFSIWGISRNLRAEKQGVLGSQIASEAAADPGVNRMVGDLRRYLAGSDLDQAGVAKVEIVAADRVISSATRERGHVYRLSIVVYCTIHNTVADDADNPATALDRIDATYQLARSPGADEAEYPDDYTEGSGALTGVVGLAANLPALTYTIGGTEYTASLTAITLSANVDAYRYVTDGSVWSVAEVATGAAMPTTPSGSLLVAVTTTGSSGVTLDRVVSAHLYDLGVTDEIDTSD